MLAPAGRLAQHSDETAVGPEQGPARLRDRSASWPFLRRRKGLIAGATAFAVAAAVALMAVLPPRYTAMAALIVDPQRQALVQTEAVPPGVGGDAAAVESQVEVLESTVVARRVIERLGLERDPEFVGSSWLGRRVDEVLAATGHPRPPAPPERVAEQALRQFQENLRVRRRGLTYVLEAEFVSSDPEKAARIANAVVEAYLADQVSAKREATSRAAGWLSERTAELRARVVEAERAVADYKAAHGVADAADGKALDRQIADLSAQLGLARARTADARSRLDQASKASGRMATPGDLPESLQSPVIADLRAEHARAARSAADAAQTFGARHPTVANLKAQVADLRRRLDIEVARLAAALRSEFEAAQGQERSLEASLAALKEQSTAYEQTAARLRELERETEARRAVLEQFLLHSKQTSEPDDLQRADARVLSPATAPLRPSFPKPGELLPLAALAGLAIGVGMAALAEARRRGFRTAREVEAALSVPVLGLLPIVPDRDLRLPHEPRRAGRIGRDLRLKRFGLDRQLTPFGEAVRAIRTRLVGTLPVGNGGKVLLATSALPHEGKSTVAANLAHSLARGGLATLLVDADVRREGLVVPRADKPAGLIQVLRDNVSLEPLLVVDPNSGLKTLPIGAVESVADGSELVGGKAMANLLHRLRPAFDVVLLDGPPILPFADGRQLLHLSDRALVVLAWAATDRDSLEALVEALGPEAGKIAGVVLNKVDLRAYRLYDYGYA